MTSTPPHACLYTPMKGCQKSEETELTSACCENTAKAAPCLELLLLVSEYTCQEWRC